MLSEGEEALFDCFRIEAFDRYNLVSRFRSADQFEIPRREPELDGEEFQQGLVGLPSKGGA